MVSRWSRWVAMVAVIAPLMLVTRTSLAQQVPTLPPPPAPASSVKILAAHLTAALYASPIGEGARLEIIVGGSAATRVEAATLIGDAVEAELRRSAVSFVRRPAGTNGAGVEPTERVEIVLVIKDGHLMATARRRILPQNIWEALADSQGRIVATGYANIPLDLELRSVFGIGRRDVRLDRAKLVSVSRKSSGLVGVGRVLDCAVGDFDGDRLPELVLVGTHVVRVARWAEGGFSQELASFPLDSLSAPESRLREPLGRIVPVVRADGTRVLVVASSERGEPVVLGFERGALNRAALPFQRGWPLYATGIDSFLVGPWPAGVDTLEGVVTEARFGTAAANWVGAVSRVYDVRGDHVASRPATLAATSSQRLLISLAGSAASLPSVGVSALMTDLDGDGLIELLTTSTVVDGPDRLSLIPLARPAGRNALPPVDNGGRIIVAPTLPPRGALPRPIWTGVAPAPVTALCAGDVDRDGFEEVVLATWNGRESELFLVVPR